MSPTLQKQIQDSTRRCIIWLVIVCFSLNLIAPQIAYAQVALLPQPGVMVQTSTLFTPAILTGMKLDATDPLKIDFLIDTGDDKLAGEPFKNESQKLINYFFAALTVPEDQMWVNLSPYEKDRIIAQPLSETAMGRDMLAQDYLLKQLSASMLYPEDELGKKFWDRVYKKAQAQYGTTDIPLNTFNKIWIVPEKAMVYVHEDTVFVSGSHLKVMLEEDYLALKEHSAIDPATIPGKTEEDKIISGVSSEIVRQVLIPEIEKEINEGKNFAPLRQMFHSLILAAWYKKNLKESVLGRLYIDRNKIDGVDIAEKDIKEKIYNQYIAAFKKGVFDYIKEDVDPVDQHTVPRRYFSGGVDMAQLSQKGLEEGLTDSLREAAATRQFQTVSTYAGLQTTDQAIFVNEDQFKTFIDEARKAASIEPVQKIIIFFQDELLAQFPHDTEFSVMLTLVAGKLRNKTKNQPGQFSMFAIGNEVHIEVVSGTDRGTPMGEDAAMLSVVNDIKKASLVEAIMGIFDNIGMYDRSGARELFKTVEFNDTSGQTVQADAFVLWEENPAEPLDQAVVDSIWDIQKYLAEELKLRPLFRTGSTTSVVERAPHLSVVKRTITGVYLQLPPVNSPLFMPDTLIDTIHMHLSGLLTAISMDRELTDQSMMATENRLELRVPEWGRVPEREENEREAERRASIDIRLQLGTVYGELEQVIAQRRDADTPEKLEAVEIREQMLINQLRNIYSDMPVRIPSGESYDFYSQALTDLKASRRKLSRMIELADAKKDKDTLRRLNLDSIRNKRLLVKVQIRIAGMLLTGKSRDGVRHPVPALNALEGAINSASALETELEYRIQRLRAQKVRKAFETNDWLGNRVRTYRLGTFDIEVEEQEDAAAEPTVMVRQKRPINVHTRLDQIRLHANRGEVEQAQEKIDELLGLYQLQYLVTLESYKNISQDLTDLRGVISGLTPGQKLEAGAIKDDIRSRVQNLAANIHFPKQMIWADVPYKGLRKAFDGHVKKIASELAQYMVVLKNKTDVTYYAKKLKEADQRKERGRKTPLSQHDREQILTKLQELQAWTGRGFVMPKIFATIDFAPAITLLEADDFKRAEAHLQSVIRRLDQRLKDIDRITANLKVSAASLYAEYRDEDIIQRANGIIQVLKEGEYASARELLTELNQEYFDQVNVEPGLIRAGLKMVRAIEILSAGTPDTANQRRLVWIVDNIRHDIAHKTKLKINITNEKNIKRIYFVEPGTTVQGLLNIGQRDAAKVRITIDGKKIARAHFDRTRLMDETRVVISADQAIIAQGAAAPAVARPLTLHEIKTNARVQDYLLKRAKALTAKMLVAADKDFGTNLTFEFLSKQASLNDYPKLADYIATTLEPIRKKTLEYKKEGGSLDRPWPDQELEGIAAYLRGDASHTFPVAQRSAGRMFLWKDAEPLTVEVERLSPTIAEVLMTDSQGRQWMGLVDNIDYFTGTLDMVYAINQHSSKVLTDPLHFVTVFHKLADGMLYNVNPAAPDQAMLPDFVSETDAGFLLPYMPANAANPIFVREPKEYRPGRKLYGDLTVRRRLIEHLRGYLTIAMERGKKPSSRAFELLDTFLARPALLYLTVREIEEIGYDYVKELADVREPMSSYKTKALDIALELLPTLQDYVASGNGSFEQGLRAVELALKGNMTSSTEFRRVATEKNIQALVDYIPSLFAQQIPYHRDDRARLVTALLDKSPKKVVYIFDNIIEYIYDLPLILLMVKAGHQITLVGKETEADNDVTADDLKSLLYLDEVKEFLGGEAVIKRQISVISSGSKTRGTDLRRATVQFAWAWEGADIIISKGEGNRGTLKTPAGLTKDVYFITFSKAQYEAEDIPLGMGAVEFVSADTAMLGDYTTYFARTLGVSQHLVARALGESINKDLLLQKWDALVKAKGIPYELDEKITIMLIEGLNLFGHPYDSNKMASYFAASAHKFSRYLTPSSHVFASDIKLNAPVEAMDLDYPSGYFHTLMYLLGNAVDWVHFVKIIEESSQRAIDPELKNLIYSKDLVLYFNFFNSNAASESGKRYFNSFAELIQFYRTDPKSQISLLPGTKLLIEDITGELTPVVFDHFDNDMTPNALHAVGGGFFATSIIRHVVVMEEPFADEAMTVTADQWRSAKVNLQRQLIALNADAAVFGWINDDTVMQAAKLFARDGNFSIAIDQNRKTINVHPTDEAMLTQIDMNRGYTVKELHARVEAIEQMLMTLSPDRKTIDFNGIINTVPIGQPARQARVFTVWLSDNTRRFNPIDSNIIYEILSALNREFHANPYSTKTAPNSKEISQAYLGFPKDKVLTTYGEQHFIQSVFTWLLQRQAMLQAMTVKIESDPLRVDAVTEHPASGKKTGAQRLYMLPEAFYQAYKSKLYPFKTVDILRANGEELQNMTLLQVIPHTDGYEILVRSQDGKEIPVTDAIRIYSPDFAMIADWTVPPEQQQALKMTHPLKALVGIKGRKVTVYGTARHAMKYDLLRKEIEQIISELQAPANVLQRLEEFNVVITSSTTNKRASHITGMLSKSPLNGQPLIADANIEKKTLILHPYFFSEDAAPLRRRLLSHELISHIAFQINNEDQALAHTRALAIFGDDQLGTQEKFKSEKVFMHDIREQRENRSGLNASLEGLVEPSGRDVLLAATQFLETFTHAHGGKVFDGISARKELAENPAVAAAFDRYLNGQISLDDVIAEIDQTKTQWLRLLFDLGIKNIRSTNIHTVTRQDEDATAVVFDGKALTDDPKIKKIVFTYKAGYYYAITQIVDHEEGKGNLAEGGLRFKTPLEKDKSGKFVVSDRAAFETFKGAYAETDMISRSKYYRNTITQTPYAGAKTVMVVHPDAVTVKGKLLRNFASAMVDVGLAAEYVIGTESGMTARDQDILSETIKQRYTQHLQYELEMLKTKIGENLSALSTTAYGGLLAELEQGMDGKKFLQDPLMDVLRQKVAALAPLGQQNGGTSLVKLFNSRLKDDIPRIIGAATTGRLTNEEDIALKEWSLAAYSTAMSVEAIGAYLHLDKKNIKVGIKGATTGGSLALMLTRLGYTVVAIEDIHGTVYKPEGFSIADLERLETINLNTRNVVKWMPEGNGVQHLTNGAILDKDQVDLDIFISAAPGRTVNPKTIAKLRGKNDQAGREPLIYIEAGFNSFEGYEKELAAKGILAMKATSIGFGGAYGSWLEDFIKHRFTSAQLKRYILRTPRADVVAESNPKVNEQAVLVKGEGTKMTGTVVVENGKVAASELDDILIGMSIDLNNGQVYSHGIDLNYRVRDLKRSVVWGNYLVEQNMDGIITKSNHPELAAGSQAKFIDPIDEIKDTAYNDIAGIAYRMNTMVMELVKRGFTPTQAVIKIADLISAKKERLEQSKDVYITQAIANIVDDLSREGFFFPPYLARKIAIKRLVSASDIGITLHGTSYIFDASGYLQEQSESASQDGYGNIRFDQAKRGTYDISIQQVVAAEKAHDLQVERQETPALFIRRPLASLNHRIGIADESTPAAATGTIEEQGLGKFTSARREPNPQAIQYILDQREQKMNRAGLDQAIPEIAPARRDILVGTTQFLEILSHYEAKQMKGDVFDSMAARKELVDHPDIARAMIGFLYHTVTEDEMKALLEKANTQWLGILFDRGIKLIKQTNADVTAREKNEAIAIRFDGVRLTGIDIKKEIIFIYLPDRFYAITQLVDISKADHTKGGIRYAEPIARANDPLKRTVDEVAYDIMKGAYNDLNNLSVSQYSKNVLAGIGYAGAKTYFGVSQDAVPLKDNLLKAWATAMVDVGLMEVYDGGPDVGMSSANQETIIAGIVKRYTDHLKNEVTLLRAHGIDLYSLTLSQYGRALREIEAEKGSLFLRDSLIESMRARLILALPKGRENGSFILEKVFSGTLSDEIQKIIGSAVTGGSARVGAISHVDLAVTGQSTLSSIEAIIQYKGLDPSSIKVAVIGAGDVGGSIALKLARKGYQVVTISDINGAVYKAAGFTVAELQNLNNVQPGDRNVLQWMPEQEGVRHLSGTDILNKNIVDIDLLVPAAMGGIINEKTIDLLRGKGDVPGRAPLIIIEGSNNAFVGMEAQLAAKGILAVSGMSVNFGGVKGSTKEAMLKHLKTVRELREITLRKNDGQVVRTSTKTQVNETIELRNESGTQKIGTLVVHNGNVVRSDVNDIPIGANLDPLDGRIYNRGDDLGYRIGSLERILTWSNYTVRLNESGKVMASNHPDIKTGEIFEFLDPMDKIKKELYAEIDAIAARNNTMVMELASLGMNPTEAVVKLANALGMRKAEIYEATEGPDAFRRDKIVEKFRQDGYFMVDHIARNIAAIQLAAEGELSVEAADRTVTFDAQGRIKDQAMLNKQNNPEGDQAVLAENIADLERTASSTFVAFTEVQAGRNIRVSPAMIMSELDYLFTNLLDNKGKDVQRRAAELYRFGAMATQRSASMNGDPFRKFLHNWMTVLQPTEMSFRRYLKKLARGEQFHFLIQTTDPERPRKVTGQDIADQERAGDSPEFVGLADAFIELIQLRKDLNQEALIDLAKKLLEVPPYYADSAMTAQVNDQQSIIFDIPEHETPDMAMLEEIIAALSDGKTLAVTVVGVSAASYLLYRIWRGSLSRILHRLHSKSLYKGWEAIQLIGKRKNPELFDPLLELLDHQGLSGTAKSEILAAILNLDHPSVLDARRVVGRLKERMPQAKRNKLDQYTAEFFLQAWGYFKEGYDFNLIFEAGEGHVDHTVVMPEHPGYPNYYDTSSNTAAANEIDMEYAKKVRVAQEEADTGRWVFDVPEVFKLERGEKLDQDQAMTAGTDGQGSVRFVYSNHLTLMSHREKIRSVVRDADILILEEIDEGSALSLDYQRVADKNGISAGDVLKALKPNDPLFKNPEVMLGAIEKSGKIIIGSRAPQADWKNQLVQHYADMVRSVRELTGDPDAAIDRYTRAVRAVADLHYRRDTGLTAQIRELQAQHPGKNIAVIRGASHTLPALHFDNAQRDFLETGGRGTVFDPGVILMRKYYYAKAELLSPETITEADILSAIAFTAWEVSKTDEQIAGLNTRTANDIFSRVKDRSLIRDLGESLKFAGISATDQQPDDVSKVSYVVDTWLKTNNLATSVELGALYDYAMTAEVSGTTVNRFTSNIAVEASVENLRRELRRILDEKRANSKITAKNFVVQLFPGKNVQALPQENLQYFIPAASVEFFEQDLMKAVYAIAGSERGLRLEDKVFRLSHNPDDPFVGISIEDAATEVLLDILTNTDAGKLPDEELYKPETQEKIVTALREKGITVLLSPMAEFLSSPVTVKIGHDGHDMDFVPTHLTIRYKATSTVGDLVEALRKSVAPDAAMTGTAHAPHRQLTQTFLQEQVDDTLNDTLGQDEAILGRLRSEDITSLKTGALRVHAGDTVSAGELIAQLSLTVSPKDAVAIMASMKEFDLLDEELGLFVRNNYKPGTAGRRLAAFATAGILSSLPVGSYFLNADNGHVQAGLEETSSQLNFLVQDKPDESGRHFAKFLDQIQRLREQKKFEKAHEQLLKAYDGLLSEVEDSLAAQLFESRKETYRNQYSEITRLLGEVGQERSAPATVADFKARLDAMALRAQSAYKTAMQRPKAALKILTDIQTRLDVLAKQGEVLPKPMNMEVYVHIMVFKSALETLLREVRILNDPAIIKPRNSREVLVFWQGQEEFLPYTAPGGIDFNTRNMQLNETGTTFTFEANDLPLNTLTSDQINGLQPVIINITPVTNLFLLLGLNAKREDAEDTAVQPSPLENPSVRDRSGKTARQELSLL